LEGVVYYSPPRYPNEPALLAGLGFPWHTLEVDDTAYLEFLDRLRSGEELLRAEGGWFHPHPQARHHQVRLAGGTVYPANALPMTAEDWRSHFGRAWDSLLTAKNRYDPDRILAPGQLRFGMISTV
jgi:hypothetical protein